MKRFALLIPPFVAVVALAGFAFLAFGRGQSGTIQRFVKNGVRYRSPYYGPIPTHFKVQHSVAEWHRLLSPEAFEVLRNEGTEPAWSGSLLKENRPGIYVCAACGHELFSSSAKYDSGEGWPSFFEPISKHAVLTREDDSDFDIRTEVICPVCGSHLGHVFHDGPKPTGLRFCIDSVALKFIPKPAVRKGR